MARQVLRNPLDCLDPYIVLSTEDAAATINRLCQERTPLGLGMSALALDKGTRSLKLERDAVGPLALSQRNQRRPRPTIA